MKLINMVCPHCGAQLEIEDGRKQVYCGHCGSKLLIDDEVVHHKLDDAEEAGYRFEKGRLKAQAEARMQQQEQEQAHSFVPPDPERPKKRRTWLWILGWLFIFPVPLTILMLRKKDMNPVLKYGIITVGWIVYLAFGMNGGKNSGKTSEKTGNSRKTIVSESSAASRTEETKGTAQDLRPQRNGFDHCNTITQGLYEFQVPDYFAQDNNMDFYRGYAETSGKTAMLYISSSFEDNGIVGEERLDAQGNSFLSAVENSENVEDVRIISKGTYNTETYTGQLFKFRMTIKDLPCSGQCLILPSEDNNHWVFVALSYTDNTEYRYDDDFKRIINNIRKVDTAVTEP